MRALSDKVSNLGVVKVAKSINVYAMKALKLKLTMIQNKLIPRSARADYDNITCASTPNTNLYVDSSTKNSYMSVFVSL